MTAEYYITDGTKFVKQNISGNYATVNNISLADNYQSSKVAKAVLENSLPKIWRNTFYVAKYENNELVKCYLTAKEKKEVIIREDNRGEYSLSLYSFEYDEDVQNLIKGFEDVKNTLSIAMDRYRKLEKSLLTTNYIAEDLKHYTLRKNLNAVNKCKLSNIRQRVWLRRVSIKNQMEILNKINQHQTSILSQVKDIVGTINNVKNRKYIPRILTDLFETDNIDGVEDIIRSEIM